ncbi:hypothetical protein JOB18_011520 [Solea senegalensis]|uniref:Uncharacterized protein n=1 Tax=Solea senegalensis TaxID=28829 RepID=A0AAV6SFE1_SOLSE|nr:hypothetical protein JOB18_011520 [Solea senegalensis]
MEEEDDKTRGTLSQLLTLRRLIHLRTDCAQSRRLLVGSVVMKPKLKYWMWKEGSLERRCLIFDVAAAIGDVFDCQSLITDSAYLDLFPKVCCPVIFNIQGRAAL